MIHKFLKFCCAHKTVAYRTRKFISRSEEKMLSHRQVFFGVFSVPPPKKTLTRAAPPRPGTTPGSPRPRRNGNGIYESLRTDWIIYESNLRMTNLMTWNKDLKGI